MMYTNIWDLPIWLNIDHTSINQHMVFMFTLRLCQLEQPTNEKLKILTKPNLLSQIKGMISFLPP